MTTYTEPAPGVPRPVGTVFNATGAMVSAHLSFLAATDNRRGRAQTVVGGTVEELHWPPNDDGFTGVELRIVGGLDLFPQGDSARYLIDDGHSLALYYVATFHSEHRTIGLKHDTAGHWDPDTDGPKRLYHLKITARRDTPGSES